MLMTTTSVLEGRPVSRYLGIVTGEAIIGANVFRDMFAAVRDIVGGRSATYEKALAEARDVALAEMAQARRGAGRQRRSSASISTTRSSARPTAC